MFCLIIAKFSDSPINILSRGESIIGRLKGREVSNGRLCFKMLFFKINNKKGEINIRPNSVDNPKSFICLKKAFQKTNPLIIRNIGTINKEGA